MNRRAVILYLCAATFLFGLAGTRHQFLLEARRTEGLNQTEPIDNAPPLVAFTTVALGGFRGIIADTLWIRASRMQTEGRYFELVQLSDWITKLEPRFTTVWAFHAWNMSYNVSVMFPDYEDRWRWVRHGISLLTEEGLKYNPDAPDLYRELGWLYQHKISATQDNGHWHYKREWAREMNLLIPNGDLNNVTSTSDADQPGDQELREVMVTRFGKAQPTRIGDLETMVQAVTSDTSPETRERYRNHARRHLLETSYRMSLQAMQHLEATYGKQDWRKPQVHAVFWAMQGQNNSTEFSQVALQRMISQSFADLFLNGGAYIGSDLSQTYMDVHLNALQGAQRAFKDAIRTFPDIATFKPAYQNFLQRAILETWLQGEDDDALRRPGS